MKITYLGTAAAEGFPALFCNCTYCNEARRLGGKNIRTRSQTLINNDLLIDFPPDTYHHFLSCGIEGDLIKHVLITHSHHDHLYVDDFNMRGSAFSHDERVKELEVFASGNAYERLVNGVNRPEIKLNELTPFVTATVGDYEVTQLPARHGAGKIGAVNYILKGDKTLLYLHDTGYPYEQTFSFIKERGFLFDMVSYDCTNVMISISDEGSHMGIPNNIRVRDRLREIGAINDATVSVINHFSHNGNPLYDNLTELVKDEGFLVSYDGFSVEI